MDGRKKKFNKSNQSQWAELQEFWRTTRFDKRITTMEDTERENFIINLQIIKRSERIIT